MSNLSMLLESSIQADWIVKSFPIIRIALVGIMFVAAIVLIVMVLMQSSSSQGGTNAISGIQESYYNDNKGGTREGRIKKTTIIMGCLIAVCIVLYFVSLLINNPTV